MNSKAALDLERMAGRLDIIGKMMTFLDSAVPPVAAAAASTRDKVFNAIERNAPLPLVHGLLWPGLVHVLAVMVSLCLLVAVLVATGINLFAFHPICMTIGCVLLMSEGFLVYRNGALVNCLSPIMAGNHKTKSRSIHVFLQAGGASFMLAGLVFIASNKLRLGKSIVPASLHAWLGAFALLAVAVQALVGLVKTTSSAPVHRWHGSAGKLAYDLCMGAVFSGAVSFLPLTAINATVLLGLLVLWLSSQFQHLMGERKSGESRQVGIEMSGQALLSKEGLSPGIAGGVVGGEATFEEESI